jgi:hypothetical protein
MGLQLLGFLHWCLGRFGSNCRFLVLVLDLLVQLFLLDFGSDRGRCRLLRQRGLSPAPDRFSFPRSWECRKYLRRRSSRVGSKVGPGLPDFLKESKLLTKALKTELTIDLRPSRFAARQGLSRHLDHIWVSAGASTNRIAAGLVVVSHGELFSRGESKPGTAHRCRWRVLPSFKDGIGVADTSRHPVHGSTGNEGHR